MVFKLAIFENHTIAEELIALCSLEMVVTIVRNEARKQLELRLLSNIVFQNRFADLTSEILEKVITYEG